MAAERFSMVVFSGTVDRLYPVAIMASGAVAMGMEVDVFVTFWGLEAFRKGNPRELSRVSRDFEDRGPAMMQVLREKNVPSWYDTLLQAKELGQVHVYACAMTMDLFGLTRDDLDPIVDEVAGVGEFVERAREGRVTLFI